MAASRPRSAAAVPPAIPAPSPATAMLGTELPKSWSSTGSETELTLVPVRAPRPLAEGEIDAGRTHRPVRQQQDQHGIRPPVGHDLAEFVRRLQPQCSRCDGLELGLHLAQQRQTLREVRRQHEVGQVRRRAWAGCGAVSCRGWHRVCRRRAGAAPPAATDSGPAPAIMVRPPGSRPCAFSAVCAPPAVIDARQGPAGDRERPLLRAGGDDDAPCFDAGRALPSIETPTMRLWIEAPHRGAVHDHRAARLGLVGQRLARPANPRPGSTRLVTGVEVMPR